MPGWGLTVGMGDGWGREIGTTVLEQQQQEKKQKNKQTKRNESNPDGQVVTTACVQEAHFRGWFPLGVFPTHQG